MRRGDVVAETVTAARGVGAKTVFVTADVSAYAADRERRLGKELDLRLVEGNFVVPPGEVASAGKDHYEVFTPYHRAWSQVPPGAPLAAPRAIRLPPPRAKDFVLIQHKLFLSDERGRTPCRAPRRLC